MILARVHIPVVVQLFAQMERRGVVYGYGIKAPRLDCPESEIHSIDCSGLVRYLLYRGTAGRLVLPDGSQNQREFMEASGAHRLARYDDVIYANEGRLFVCYIKPFTNGCGSVGHTWLATRFPGMPTTWTIESHGGGGCVSRPWNYPTLKREAYSAFELPSFGFEGEKGAPTPTL